LKITIVGIYFIIIFSNDAAKQKLNRELATSSNISSKTLFGNENGTTEEGSMDKIKGFVSDAG
jgi:hypothetical protein